MQPESEDMHACVYLCTIIVFIDLLLRKIV